MNKRKFLISFILLVIALIAIFQIRSHFIILKKMPAVKVILPTQGEIVTRISVEGNIEAQEVMRIDASISGKIQLSENLKPCSRISKGDIMIVIVPDEENIKAITEELKEAEEDLRLSQKKLGVLKKDCESEQAVKIDRINLDRAKRKYELSKKLYEMGIISQQEMETEEINLMREESSIVKRKESALSELEIERLNVIKKEGRMKKLKEQLNPREIVSLFDGVIIKITVKNGEIVPRSQELITLVNPQNLNAVLRVPGENISKIKEGQRVLIKKEYYSTHSLSGMVKEISMLSEESSSGGKDCFKVRVGLPQLIGEDLIMGINKVIYGEIILEEKANAIRIPFDAIHYEETGTPFVFIFVDGMVKKQRIMIGIKGEEYIEIKNGVGLRDKIIIEENSELTDGQRVKLQGKDG